MAENYWIYEDCFIFKPEFNAPIDDYIEIIKNYNKLIFSDYNDPKICIETNNWHDVKYHVNLQQSKFNQPLRDSLSNLINLTHLTFGWDFNQPLGDSLSNLVNLTHLTFNVCFICPLGDSLSNLINLTHLTFDYYFNHPLGDSLSNLINLTHLTFDERFNQPLTDSLVNLINLTHLTLGYEFNFQLEIPSNIKFLKIDCDNANLINNLPNSIEELNLGWRFDLELDNLPNSIKIIKFDSGSCYDKDLLNLPKFLEILELRKNYGKEIKNINPTCKIIYI